VLTHGLCWIHAERLIHQLIPLNEQHREDQQAICAQVWDFCTDLKKYQQAPLADKKAELDRRFDEIFTTKTRFETLNQVLKRLHRNKSELLLVLERPEVPLHTHDSERDIRDYVKKRKVSGGTRSDLGRRCRDTFASLKKTCRKLGVSLCSSRSSTSPMNSVSPKRWVRARRPPKRSSSYSPASLTAAHAFPRYAGLNSMQWKIFRPLGV
jgi:hypothetical protein